MRQKMKMERQRMMRRIALKKGFDAIKMPRTDVNTFVEGIRCLLSGLLFNPQVIEDAKFNGKFSIHQSFLSNKLFTLFEEFINHKFSLLSLHIFDELIKALYIRKFKLIILFCY